MRIIKSDAISFSAKLGVYTVRVANGTVKLNPLTCGMKGDQCIHKLAILLSNGFKVDDNVLKEINLYALLFEEKETKKSGRKVPRAGDVRGYCTGT